jgi:hypothetical protein
VKVITPGRPQRGWSREETCSGRGNGNGGCGAILLVESADLFQTTTQCRDETDYFVTFKCSECGVLTDMIDPPSAALDAARANGVRNPVRAR